MEFNILDDQSTQQITHMHLLLKVCWRLSLMAHLSYVGHVAGAIAGEATMPKNHKVGKNWLQLSCLPSLAHLPGYVKHWITLNVTRLQIPAGLPPFASLCHNQPWKRMHRGESHRKIHLLRRSKCAEHCFRSHSHMCMQLFGLFRVYRYSNRM